MMKKKQILERIQKVLNWVNTQYAHPRDSNEDSIFLLGLSSELGKLWKEIDGRIKNGI